MRACHCHHGKQPQPAAAARPPAHRAAPTARLTSLGFMSSDVSRVAKATARTEASSTALPKVFQKMRPSWRESSSLTSSTASSGATGRPRGSDVTYLTKSRGEIWPSCSTS